MQPHPEALENEKKQAGMLKKYNELFNSTDTDGSGYIDMDELRQLFIKRGYNLSFAQINRIYRLIDENGDGRLSRPEFTRMMYVFDNSKPEEADKVEFLVADVDYSGELDANELQVVLKKMGVEKPAVEVQAAIKQVSGGKDVVTLETYGAFLAALNVKDALEAFKAKVVISEKPKERAVVETHGPKEAGEYVKYKDPNTKAARDGEDKQAATMKRYNQLFAEADTMKRNYIEVDELKEFFNKKGYKMSFPQLYRLYKIIDLNGDGRVTRPEFTRVMYIIDNAKPDELAKVEFLAADSDFSGALDANELLIVLKRLGHAKDIAEVKAAVDAMGGQVSLAEYPNFLQKMGADK